MGALDEQKHVLLSLPEMEFGSQERGTGRADISSSVKLETDTNDEAKAQQSSGEKPVDESDANGEPSSQAVADEKAVEA